MVLVIGCVIFENIVEYEKCFIEVVLLFNLVLDIVVDEDDL